MTLIFLAGWTICAVFLVGFCWGYHTGTRDTKQEQLENDPFDDVYVQGDNRNEHSTPPSAA